MDLDVYVTLQALPGLEELTPEQLTELARWMVVRRLETDQFLFHQGEVADSMFLVVEGMLRLDQRDRRGAMQPIGNLRPGETIGEDALFDRAPRAATCISSTQCVLAELSADDLAIVERRAPTVASRLISALSQAQARKLRRVNGQTEALIRKYAEPGLLQIPKPGQEGVTVMGKLWARITRN